MEGKAPLHSAYAVTQERKGDIHEILVIEKLRTEKPQQVYRVSDTLIGSVMMILQNKFMFFFNHFYIRDQFLFFGTFRFCLH